MKLDMLVAVLFYQDQELQLLLPMVVVVAVDSILVQEMRLLELLVPVVVVAYFRVPDQVLQVHQAKVMAAVMDMNQTFPLVVVAVAAVLAVMLMELHNMLVMAV
jgi:hypothetical protein